MIRLLIFKLKRMRKFFQSKYCHIKDWRSVVQEITKAINIFEAIKEEQFCETEFQAHKEKWGKLVNSYISDPKYPGRIMYRYLYSNAKTGKEQKQAKEEIYNIHELSATRINEAYIEVFNLIGKNCQKWWD